ncbi:MAG: response regulator transcription factor [Acidiferrobacter sp.]
MEIHLDSASRQRGLSTRELEVLKWMCWGKTNTEIGDILCISPWTAKIHVGNVLRKLGVENRTQAAVCAIREAILW